MLLLAIGLVEGADFDRLQLFDKVDARDLERVGVHALDHTPRPADQAFWQCELDPELRICMYFVSTGDLYIISTVTHQRRSEAWQGSSGDPEGRRSA